MWWVVWSSKEGWAWGSEAVGLESWGRQGRGRRARGAGVSGRPTGALGLGPGRARGCGRGAAAAGSGAGAGAQGRGRHGVRGEGRPCRHRPRPRGAAPRRAFGATQTRPGSQRPPCQKHPRITVAPPRDEPGAGSAPQLPLPGTPQDSRSPRCRLRGTNNSRGFQVYSGQEDSALTLRHDFN